MKPAAILLVLALAIALLGSYALILLACWLAIGAHATREHEHAPRFHVSAALNERRRRERLGLAWGEANRRRA